MEEFKTYNYVDFPDKLVRVGDWKDITQSTWAIAEKAIKSGKADMAGQMLKQAWRESLFTHDALARIAYKFLDYAAQTYGEEEVGKVWTSISAAMLDLRVAHSPPNAIEGALVDCQVQRGHFCGPTEYGEHRVVEEKDRYVCYYDPCGTGGKLRRQRKGGFTKKAYQWSWGRTGVHYYCVHCSTFFEIDMIRTIGYPTRIHENVDKPDEPCVHIYYKRPEDIPERYFTQFGFKKGPVGVPNKTA